MIFQGLFFVQGSHVAKSFFFQMGDVVCALLWLKQAAGRIGGGVVFSGTYSQMCV